VWRAQLSDYKGPALTKCLQNTLLLQNDADFDLKIIMLEHAIFLGMILKTPLSFARMDTLMSDLVFTESQEALSSEFIMKATIILHQYQNTFRRCTTLPFGVEYVHVNVKYKLFS